VSRDTGRQLRGYRGWRYCEFFGGGLRRRGSITPICAAGRAGRFLILSSDLNIPIVTLLRQLL
jgi:hypothetical protein